MTPSRVRTALLAGAVGAGMLGGCGSQGARHAPALARLPLVPGARVGARLVQCDPGASSYCALELVLLDPAAGTSRALLEAEQKRLRTAGWSTSNAYTGDERAAESPRHDLRVTLATADEDLKGIDLGWIQRGQSITLALSHAIFQHAPALSIMLEAGSA